MTWNLLEEKQEMAKLGANIKRDIKLCGHCSDVRWKSNVNKRILKDKTAFCFLAAEIESQAWRLAGVARTAQIICCKSCFTDWLGYLNHGQTTCLRIRRFWLLMSSISGEKQIGFSLSSYRTWDEILKNNNVMLIYLVFAYLEWCRSMLYHMIVHYIWSQNILNTAGALPFTNICTFRISSWAGGTNTQWPVVSQNGWNFWGWQNAYRTDKECSS